MRGGYIVAIIPTGKGCREGKVAGDEGGGSCGVMGILAGTGNSVPTSN